MTTPAPDANFASELVRVTDRYIAARLAHVIRRLGQDVVARALEELEMLANAFTSLDSDEKEQFIRGNIQALSNDSLAPTDLEKYDAEMIQTDMRACGMFAPVAGYDLGPVKSGGLGLRFNVYDEPNDESSGRFFGLGRDRRSPHQTHAISLRAESTNDGAQVTKYLRSSLFPGNDEDLPVGASDLAALNTALTQLDKISAQLETELA